VAKQSGEKAVSIDAPTLRRLAVRASCDPRTIKAVFEGTPVRGLAGERARAALIEAGLLPADERGDS
jgi:hypothetical protein